MSYLKNSYLFVFLFIYLFIHYEYGVLPAMYAFRPERAPDHIVGGYEPPHGC